MFNYLHKHVIFGKLITPFITPYIICLTHIYITHIYIYISYIYIFQYVYISIYIHTYITNH